MISSRDLHRIWSQTESLILVGVVLPLLFGNAFGFREEPSETGNPQSAIHDPKSKEKIRFSADSTEGSRIGGELVKTYRGNVTVAHAGTVLHADEATYVQSEKEVLLRGHVSAADSESGRVLRADEATYYQTHEKVAFSGNVSVADSISMVTSDRMTYLVSSKELTAQKEVVATHGQKTLKAKRLKTRWEEKTVLAEGSVEFTDEENRLTLTCGRLEYDDRAQFGLATGSPKVTRKGRSSEEPIAVSADTLTVQTVEGKAVALGHVHLVKGSLEAFCDSATYFQKEERAVLSMTPRVFQRSGDPEKDEVLRKNALRGNMIQLTLKDDVPSEVTVFGEAEATSTTLDSTGAETSDTSFLKGRILTMKLEAEKLSEMDVSGNAVSTYRTSGEADRQAAENHATGDRIVLFFDGGNLSRVLIEGGVLGTYYFASKQAALPQKAPSAQNEAR
ncbi:MAG: LptA/OstA family protein [Candidatus Latescibacterota bacterium]